MTACTTRGKRNYTQDTKTTFKKKTGQKGNLDSSKICSKLSKLNKTRINELNERNKGKIWRRRFPVVGLVYMHISRQNEVITASKPKQCPAELPD